MESLSKELQKSLDIAVQNAVQKKKEDELLKKINLKNDCELVEEKLKECILSNLINQNNIYRFHKNYDYEIESTPFSLNNEHLYLNLNICHNKDKIEELEKIVNNVGKAMSISLGFKVEKKYYVWNKWVVKICRLQYSHF